jgi:hypothetical protein
MELTRGGPPFGAECRVNNLLLKIILSYRTLRIGAKIFGFEPYKK